VFSEVFGGFRRFFFQSGMLSGIFNNKDGSQFEGNRSPRTIAIDKLQLESGYYQAWNQMNQQYINNAEQITALKQKHKEESVQIDQLASDELWKNTFLPKVKMLEEAQSTLEKTRTELEAENQKKAKDMEFLLDQDASKTAKSMDSAVAKVKRIEIVYNDERSEIIRQIEPVKYFSDLEAKGRMFCPDCKIAFIVSFEY
jgi:hypothetical protein